MRLGWAYKVYGNPNKNGEWTREDKERKEKIDNNDKIWSNYRIFHYQITIVFSRLFKKKKKTIRSNSQPKNNIGCKVTFFKISYLCIFQNFPNKQQNDETKRWPISPRLAILTNYWHIGMQLEKQISVSAGLLCCV